MAWFIEARRARDSLKWRMTRRYVTLGDGPFGRLECSHDTAEQAEACELCDEFVSQISGFPSKKRTAEDLARSEREELSTLKEKYPDA